MAGLPGLGGGQSGNGVPTGPGLPGLGGGSGKGGGGILVGQGGGSGKGSPPTGGLPGLGGGGNGQPGPISGSPPPPPPPPAAAPAPPPPSTPGANDPRSNEPLPKELATNKVPWTSGLVHGYMKTAFTAGQTAPLPAGDFFVYFLFNPLQIQQQYGFDSSLIPDLYQPQANGDPANTQGNEQPFLQSAAFQNQTFQFQIEFDRTYDVWEFMIAHGRGSEGRPSGEASPGRDGCMWDVRAVERLVGLYDQTDAAASGTAPSSPAGFPNTQAIDVFFGGSGALSFRGYFTALDVELQRFNQYMVPVHAAVNITLARVFQPTDGLPLSTPSPALEDISGKVTGGTTTPAGVIGDGIPSIIDSITGGLKSGLQGGI